MKTADSSNATRRSHINQQGMNMTTLVKTPPKGKDKGAFYTQSDLNRAFTWVKGVLQKSQTSVTAMEVLLTPVMAEALLLMNKDNRRIKSRKVDDFARDMVTGNWKMNGESIIVSKDGHLNDGQHRASAVMQANKSIKTLMVFGVERDTRDTIDHGIGRSPGDDLALNGFHNTIVLAAASRMLWQWRTYGYIQHSGVKAPTRVELIEIAKNNPGLVKSALEVGSKSGKAKSLTSIAILTFCNFAFKTVAHETEVSFFFDSLIEGNDLKRGDPILNARNRLIAERNILNSSEKVELLFRAWNAHRQGETTRTAFRMSGGELPLLEA